MTYMQITIVGRIGRDSELRYTSSGQAVCSFSLATSRRWTDRGSNERKEETTWFRISVWGTQAESLNQYLTKGKEILVVGDRIKADMYTGQDGQARVNLDVTAREVRLLGGSGGGSGGNQGSGHQDDMYAPSDVDDIPF